MMLLIAVTCLAILDSAVAVPNVASHSPAAPHKPNVATVVLVTQAELRIANMIAALAEVLPLATTVHVRFVIAVACKKRMH